MPTPSAPAPDRDALARAHGAQFARELTPHVIRLRDALERARRRGAPHVKVHVDDVAALFALVRLSTQATVAVDTVRRLPWHKRLLHALRDARPAREDAAGTTNAPSDARE